MPRARNSVASHRRKKRLLKRARGYRGGRSKLYRTAIGTVERGMAYAYRDRRQKKRAFRSLWIVRINAAARMNGMSYSRLMNGLRNAGIEVSRKVLADLAVFDPDTFGALVKEASARR